MWKNRKTMKYVLSVIVSSCFFSAMGKETFINENDIPELSFMNVSVDPCEDFYEFTCGNFKNIHKIPENGLNIDNFSILQANLTLLANAILSSRNLDEDPAALKKARAAYQACLDEDFMNNRELSVPEQIVIEELGGFPLVEPDGKSAENFGWYDIGDMAAEYGVPLIFSVASYYDTQNASNMLVYVSNDPMGIPEQLKKDEESYEDIIDMDLYNLAVNARSAEIQPMDLFLRNLTLKMKRAMGSNVPDEVIFEKLDIVVNFMKGIYFGGVVDEGKEIENLTYPSVTLRELNEWTKNQFKDLELDWIEYLRRVFKYAGVEITEDTRVLSSVNFNKLLYGVINWVKTNDPSVVKSMALLRVFLYMAADSDASTRQAFEEYMAAIKKTTYPRWEYCTRKITDATGTASISFALTYEYQLRYFNVNKLSDALQMIKDLRESFKDIIKDAEWMDESSKEFALEKVENITVLLGYPDEILKNKTLLDEFYENIKICKWDNYGNSKRIRAFKQAYQLTQLNKRDKKAWEKSPFDVNAYYNRPNNRIIFPVAVLNGIFFEGKISIFDYSRIGSIVGHEITHGFDNSGRLYDQSGVVKDWWSLDTLKGFQNRTACYVDQYGKYYVPEIDAYVNASSTLNENLADNGGTRTSYRAYQRLLKRIASNKAQHSKIYTDDQLFFIGFGTMWCNNESQEFLEAWQTCASNCHARSKWRVNGVLSNMEEFSEAFSCPVGSTMNPESKCKLWW